MFKHILGDLKTTVIGIGLAALQAVAMYFAQHGVTKMGVAAAVGTAALGALTTTAGK